jgi:hypothetical protein
MVPIVVGKVEDGAEGDVGFIRPAFFDSIVDTTGVDWGEEAQSQRMPYY